MPPFRGVLFGGWAFGVFDRIFGGVFDRGPRGVRPLAVDDEVEEEEEEEEDGGGGG